MGKTRRGHYCRGCGCYRPNEQFSGKGHRQHLCKNCKKSRRKEIKKNISNNFEEWDSIIESDEHFAFIVDYTEGGAPIGITHEEWEEIERNENNRSEEQVLITVPKDVASKLKSINSQQSIDEAIHTSFAITLFLANRISIERAAYIADCHVNDFIHLLQQNQIPWNIDEKSGNEDYQRSINDLLVKIDNIIERE
ncbi:UPF0175 family protein [Niallia sp. 01092]|uniref:UPF0175 family protein n=1 Tax=unclassified Niallia TaxID=2837522 RepID=UPI003FD1BE5C